MSYRFSTTSTATVLLLFAAFGGIAHAAPPNAPDVPGPAQSTHADAIAYAANHPDSVPPGMNPTDCVPSAEHPNPVILVHGTDASVYADWAALSPALASAGYCVYGLNYGASPDGTSFGYTDIRGSAAQLKDFADGVLSATGAEQVDLVGYSQGAAVTRYFTNRLGGADVVDKWIGIASPAYGGTAYGVSPAIQAVPSATRLVSSEFGPALVQLIEGSTFLQDLNAGGDTVPGVEYTSIATDVDEVIQPYTNALLRDPDARNIVVQDVCPQNNVAHFTFTYDPTTIALVLGALDPGAGIVPPCTPVPIGAGVLDVVIASNAPPPAG
ncbi:lipase [Rhodococcus sp. RS1C4]|uniref:esterase/lipase family protein n=1 Tax=Rhodococcus sp. 114MFTsu3.1 TaxID=1172184 RepID=UPI000376830E|nr:MULTISPECIES: alpha/beta fold hydrolase [unclassified Rhodococcus (in: high G+C Gram-positive bacteria)]OZC56329.1 lipase [Rhodococcus sp. RS1C4]